ncbi:hypothetical protein MPEAHAMD_4449 [Methylobacterium frigidaeris]|uniref:Glycosyltransferase 2-like domain-containing protein n=1 Tax=Methylobacterium frigidaeris TaxID=2038277 RepID=A0AA37M651_9HYPH|nr:hypothetical protein MPEAHAMD_4449 [Methylobacterium frigidaeris]
MTVAMFIRNSRSRSKSAWSHLASEVAGAAGAALGYVWVYGLLGGITLIDWFHRLRHAGSFRTNPSDGPDLRADARTGDRRRALRIAVGIATAGRPAIARETLRRLRLQTRQPDIVVAAVPTLADLDLAPDEADPLVLVGDRGLTRQRNAILAAVDDADLVCFFDDDFVPAPTYLESMEHAFLANPDLVGATGVVVADGITGAGYAVEDAERFLEGRIGAAASIPVYNAYGCNMTFRVSAIRAGGLEFDEALPAYGWLEDVDFSRRIARFGHLERIGPAVGVHLGVKGGRQSGRRFGYSQIANPLYLVGKGSFAWPRAAWLMARNIAMNLVRSLRPEPHIDRRGRVAGNVRALADLVRGRLHPTHIVRLP